MPIARNIQSVRKRSRKESFFRCNGAQIWPRVYGVLDIAIWPQCVNLRFCLAAAVRNKRVVFIACRYDRVPSELQAAPEWTEAAKGTDRCGDQEWKTRRERHALSLLAYPSPQPDLE